MPRSVTSWRTITTSWPWWLNRRQQLRSQKCVKNEDLRFYDWLIRVLRPIGNISAIKRREIWQNSQILKLKHKFSFLSDSLLRKIISKTFRKIWWVFCWPSSLLKDFLLSDTKYLNIKLFKLFYLVFVEMVDALEATQKKPTKKQKTTTTTTPPPKKKQKMRPRPK